MKKRFKELRNKYKNFRYKRYYWELINSDLKIGFEFEINPGIRFDPFITIDNINNSALKNLKKEVIDNFVFHIGLAEIPSYWKCTCSQNIIVEAGYLDGFQRSWWKKFLIDEMSQYYYENNIDFRGKEFLKVKSTAKKKTYAVNEVKGNKILIPVGGGKDSAVTSEILLKQNRAGAAAFLLNPSKASQAVSKKAGFNKTFVVKRVIDPKLLDLNAKGYLNGHTPIVAYMSFLSLFLANLYGFKRVLFSDERSADEGNIKFLGRVVNHQHDKTLEFENLFRNYNQKYLSNVEYMSFLRPLYEIQISKIFSKIPKYHEIFRSCNVGQKENKWCCKCPKCLSTFILLAPFIGVKKTKKIFGKNLLEDKSLISYLRGFLDKKILKPLECVGTRDEIKAAIYKIYMIELEKPLLVKKVLKYFDKNINYNLLFENLINSWNKNHNLDKKFEKLLKKYI